MRTATSKRPMGPLRLTVWSRAAAPSVESSVVHLTLMELDLGLERGKPAGPCQSPDSLVESCPRLSMFTCPAVQCEFLFRLRTETRSVLERKSLKGRGSRCPEPLSRSRQGKARQRRRRTASNSSITPDMPSACLYEDRHLMKLKRKATDSCPFQGQPSASSQKPKTPPSTC